MDDRAAKVPGLKPVGPFQDREGSNPSPCIFFLIFFFLFS